MNQIQHVPISGDFSFVPVPRRSLFRYKLPDSRAGGNNSFDFIGAFGALNFCGFYEPVQLGGFVFQIQFLTPFAFVDLSNQRNDIVLPPDDLKIFIME